MGPQVGSSAQCVFAGESTESGRPARLFWPALQGPAREHAKKKACLDASTRHLRNGVQGKR